MQFEQCCCNLYDCLLLFLSGFASNSPDTDTVSGKSLGLNAFRAVQAQGAEADINTSNLLSLLAERDAELATLEAELAVARAALSGNLGRTAGIYSSILCCAQHTDWHQQYLCIKPLCWSGVSSSITYPNALLHYLGCHLACSIIRLLIVP